jgi:hypothetical protein
MSLVWDFETKGIVDLKQRGVYVYAEHPETDALLASFKLTQTATLDTSNLRQAAQAAAIVAWLQAGGEIGKLYRWRRGEPCPPFVRAYVEAGGEITAWNATFERLFWWRIMVFRYGWPRPAMEQFRCSMATAKSQGYPAKLEKFGEALDLKIKKDKRGDALIRIHSCPVKFNEDGSPVWHPLADDPASLAAFHDYCDIDVLTEEEAAERMFPLSDSELAVYHLSEEINDRGVRVDLASIDAAMKLAEKAKARLDVKMREATGGVVTACSQVAKLTEWLISRGVALDGVAKNGILETLDLPNLPDDCREALLIRQEAAKTSTAKLNAMRKHVDRRGRIPGMFVFYGTGPGRWTSAGGVNLSNLPRPRAIYDDAQLDTATLFKALRTTDPEFVETMYGPDLGKPLHLISDALRGFLCAAPGHELVIVDYSGIQSAISTWLSDETWKLTAMREIIADPTRPDLYRVAAAGILSTTTDVITKKHPMRQAVGKTSELACFGENTNVLTKTGLKRIVEVAADDELWDGVEWVKHQGVISKGARPVVDVDGIRITKDHLILLSDSWVRADQVNLEPGFLDLALATGSANLPSQVFPTANNKVYVRFSSNARADRLNNLLHYRRCAEELLRHARNAVREKLKRQESYISATPTLFPTLNIADVFSIEFPLVSLGVFNRQTKGMKITAAEALQFIGAETEKNFFGIWSLLKGGINRILNWTALKLTETTSREIYGLFQELGKQQIDEKQKRCKVELSNLKTKTPVCEPVYDILNAGPRNRLTICSDSGYLIVHNCAFSGGVPALVNMAANYGMRRAALHGLYPHVWASAPEARREEAAKTWERASKSRDRRKSDVLTREAWLACALIVSGWRERHPAHKAAWGALEAAMRDAVRSPGVKIPALGRLTYLCAHGFLMMRLPSGRPVMYPQPKLRDQVWAKLKLEDGSWTESEVCDREDAQRLEIKGLAKIEGATSPKVTALGWDSEKRKMVRYALYGGLAMQNCLARGTKVLTERGWKNIEDLTCADRLWDGDAWVSHKGLIAKGEQPTINFGGVRLTPDHKIWSRNGWSAAEHADLYEAQAASQVPRESWSALWASDGDEFRRRRREKELLANQVRLWRRRFAVRLGDGAGARDELRLLPGGADKNAIRDARDVKTRGLSRLAEYARTLPQSVASGVAQLRGSWNHGLQRVGALQTVLGGYGADLQGRPHTGTCEKRQGLFGVELPMADFQRARSKQAHQRFCQHAKRQNAFVRGARNVLDLSAGLLLASARWMARVGVIRPAGIARPQAVLKVYDVLDAGPNRRFTVLCDDGQTILVSNCALGIESCILRRGLKNCREAGYPVALHCYDEAVAEMPRGLGSVAEMSKLMLDLDPWTEGIPLACHGEVSSRYKK